MKQRRGQREKSMLRIQRVIKRLNGYLVSTFANTLLGKFLLANTI